MNAELALAAPLLMWRWSPEQEPLIRRNANQPPPFPDNVLREEQPHWKILRQVQVRNGKKIQGLKFVIISVNIYKEMQRDIHPPATYGEDSC
jgi:hypothetical protein